MLQPRCRQAHQWQCNNRYASGLVLLVENLAITPPLFFGFAAVKLGARLVAGMFALWHEHSRLSAANPKNKEYLFVSGRATYSTKTAVRGYASPACGDTNLSS